MITEEKTRVVITTQAVGFRNWRNIDRVECSAVAAAVGAIACDGLVEQSRVVGGIFKLMGAYDRDMTTDQRHLCKHPLHLYCTMLSRFIYNHLK